MTKTNIKVKVNHPETEEGMKKYEEIKVENFYKILKDMLNKDGLKLLGDALKRNKSI
ncbi:hypothetical protein [Clostridium tunisiense]|uniref:hypothetical protein n=1 Tax=Clostridium tunisiense TaxID=219748 RepID=UPI0002FAAE63|nr:hypothetical protein [Clostridium tunisiense]